MRKLLKELFPILIGLALAQSGISLWITLPLIFMSGFLFIVYGIIKSFISIANSPKEEVAVITPKHGSFTASDLKYMPKN